MEDIYVNLIVATVVMALIILPNFLFQAPVPVKKGSKGE